MPCGMCGGPLVDLLDSRSSNLFEPWLCCKYEQGGGGGFTVLCCRKCGQAISLQCHPSPRHIHVDMCQLSNCLGQPYNELDGGGLVALPLVTFSTDIRDKNIHVPL